MKIFSNFDTHSRQIALNEYRQQYGQDNVLLVSRSRLYWFVKVFFPFLVLVSFDILLLYAFYGIFEGEYFGYAIAIVLVLSLFLLAPIVGKYIDYKLDFIIVTPDVLVMYNQEGLFKKKIITVNEKSIKTVSVEKTGFWYSVFNNGDIIFLSEGDVSTGNGEITLRWIPKPEKRRNQIAQIMAKE